MEASLFTKLLSDKYITDWKKLHHKYPQADLGEFAALLGEGFYRPLPLKDFAGRPLVYLETVTQVRLSAARVLLTPQSSSLLFGRKAMEEEIVSTLSIEHLDFTRDSVRKILAGYAPADESEARIFGIKQGLEFISDPGHTITEENLFTLYRTAVGNCLAPEDQLLPGNRYRHDSVYIVGARVEHTGLPWQKLPAYLGDLVAYANADTGENDLVKAALLHFYLAYLHPWFDGNGRMARLLHLWYLVQRGYSSALFVPLSEYVEKSRQGYYRAYTLAEDNAALSGVLDATPFLSYFIDQVYHRLSLPEPRTARDFQDLLAQGSVTQKERDLWQFVLTAYGEAEFSTKQLERDFGQAAYATIRSFVGKFEALGLLTSARYANRVRYRVAP